MKFDINEIARHCLEGVCPDFASDAQADDVLVAGRDFGIGSSREQAAAALVTLGLRAVIASSYKRLVLSQCFQRGLAAANLPAQRRD